MKLVMDEKLKHRLIGLAVIISLGAIFAPAMMKKSSQNLESNYSVNVKLPPKPVAPDVVLSDEAEMFKTIKVSKVKIPAVSEGDQLPEFAKAETIQSGATATDDKGVDVASAQIEKQLVAKLESKSSQPEPVKVAVNKAAKTTAKQTVKVAMNKQQVKRASVLALKKKAAPKNLRLAAVKNSHQAKVKASLYAVQLASFSQLTNAQALVSKLRGKGYKANYQVVPGRGGRVYKVFAGHSPRRGDAVKFKAQLASAMQLNGFIVNTGVS